MEKTSEKVWKDGEEQDVEEEKPKKASSKKKLHEPVADLAEEAEEKSEDKEINAKAILKKAPKGKIPTGIKPMLATLVNVPFDDPEWVYEVKWDGYRTLGFINKGEVQLLSRNNKDFNEKYYPLKKLLESWKLNVVIDGEVLVLNDKGVSNFGALQNWRSEADGELVLYIFDILWYDGKNLMDLPLTERQAIMRDVIPTDDDRVRISQTFKANGTEFLRLPAKLAWKALWLNVATALTRRITALKTG